MSYIGKKNGNPNTDFLEAGGELENHDLVNVDASGNLLVGKTSIGFNNIGVEARESGLLIATKDGDRPLLLNRQTSNGIIADFCKDGTTVGSIGVTSAGASIKLGGTATANELDDYEEGTWTPVANNITFSAAYGTYTKIGRQVIANFRITFPSTSDTSTAYVSTTAGLPFAPHSSYINYRGGGYVTYQNKGVPDVFLYFGSQVQITNDSGYNYNNANWSGYTVHGVITYITS